jgi:HlyD family secretion protein
MAKQQKKKSNSLVKYIIIAVVVMVVALVGLRSAGVIGKAKEIEVDFAKAKKTDIVEKVSASGTVQPVTEVKIAPEVSGEIISLTVEDGDAVNEGELLVKIRPDIVLSQLERAEAGLNQQKANVKSSESTLLRAEANFVKAEQDYKRQEKLFKENVISESDWQLAQQNYKVAQNDFAASREQLEASKYIVSSTEASVKESRENVRRTAVVAPLTGVVSKLSVKQGERVVGTAQMTGTEMLRIADLSKMEVRVNVNENDIVRVHLGDTVLIDVDAYSTQEKEFKGIVTNIANTAKDKLSTDAITEFEVRILILESSYMDLIKAGNKYPFRPGMTASVEIITTRKSGVLSVPLAAVTTRGEKDLNAKGTDDSGNGPPRQDHQVVNSDQQKAAAKKEDKVVVFINDGGKAKMIEVKTGISDYDNIEIISGLDETKEVVIGPFLVVSKRLKEGDKITATKKEEAKKDEKPSGE